MICSITRFYTVAHLTAATALKQIGGEFEYVAAMGIVIFYTNAAAKVLHALAQWLVVGRFQRWRAA